MNQDYLKEQFIDLYNSLSDSIFRYCLIRVSNKEQAMDITQDSFMKFWDAICKNPDTIKKPRAFIYTIANNLIIDWYRKKKSVSLDELTDPEDEGEGKLQITDDSYLDIEMASEAKLIIEKIKELDTTYQQAVYLRFVEDLQPKEIAHILKLDANTVSVRINRGIKELQKIMFERFE